MISSASEQIGGGIEQVVASGIVDSSGAGFDLSSMMADLTQPLEVCYSTLDATQLRDNDILSSSRTESRDCIPLKETFDSKPFWYPEL